MYKNLKNYEKCDDPKIMPVYVKPGQSNPLNLFVCSLDGFGENQTMTCLPYQNTHYDQYQNGDTCKKSC
jgi:hypothetical protein